MTGNVCITFKYIVFKGQFRLKIPLNSFKMTTKSPEIVDRDLITFIHTYNKHFNRIPSNESRSNQTFSVSGRSHGIFILSIFAVFRELFV